MADLKTRERVNLILDRDLMKLLRRMSEETHIPMSRFVEDAIKEKIKREKRES